MLAYACFVNWGILPHVYAELPYRERILIGAFLEKEAKERKKLEKR